MKPNPKPTWSLGLRSDQLCIARTFYCNQRRSRMFLVPWCTAAAARGKSLSLLCEVTFWLFYHAQYRISNSYGMYIFYTHCPVCDAKATNHHQSRQIKMDLSFEADLSSKNSVANYHGISNNLTWDLSAFFGGNFKITKVRFLLSPTKT